MNTAGLKLPQYAISQRHCYVVGALETAAMTRHKDTQSKIFTNLKHQTICAISQQYLLTNPRQR